MSRFTLPRDLYHGKGSLEALKTLRGKRAIVVVGGGSMRRFGFLDKVEAYLREAGMESSCSKALSPIPPWKPFCAAPKPCAASAGLDRLHRRRIAD